LVYFFFLYGADQGVSRNLELDLFNHGPRLALGQTLCCRHYY